jgi:hypothetical protein
VNQTPFALLSRKADKLQGAPKGAKKEVEGCFWLASEVAGAQAAPKWALRAAMSLINL